MDTPRPRRVRLLDDSHMEAWRQISPVLDEYARILDVEIRVANPHGNLKPVRRDEGFLYIYFWSAPEDFASSKSSIGRAFGVELGSGRQDAREPVSGTDVHDIKDPAGTTVAQYIGSTIYVLFDLPHIESDAQTLMVAIMQQFTLERYPPGELEKILADRRLKEDKRIKELRSSSKKEFPILLKNAFQIKMDSIQGERELFANKVTLYSEQLEESQTKLDGLEKIAKIAQSILNKKSNRWSRDLFKRLTKLAQNENLWIEDNEIHIDMGQIDIKHEGNVYDIGEFELIVSISPGNSYVRCINKTRTAGSLYHPHVSCDGQCCLGNAKTTVQTLLATFELEALVVFMKAFLQSVYEPGWMGSITNFPIKRKE